jgi:hypothetical protein
MSDYGKQFRASKRRPFEDATCGTCNMKLGMNSNCEECKGSLDPMYSAKKWPNSSTKSVSQGKDPQAAQRTDTRSDSSMPAGALPLYTSVFVPSVTRIGTITKGSHGRKANEFIYDVEFDDSISVETIEVHQRGMSEFIGAHSKDSHRWPEDAFAELAVVYCKEGVQQGGGDKSDMRGGTGTVTGVAVDCFGAPSHYEITMRGKTPSQLTYLYFKANCVSKLPFDHDDFQLDDDDFHQPPPPLSKGGKRGKGAGAKSIKAGAGRAAPPSAAPHPATPPQQPAAAAPPAHPSATAHKATKPQQPAAAAPPAHSSAAPHPATPPQQPAAAAPPAHPSAAAHPATPPQQPAAAAPPAHPSAAAHPATTPQQPAAAAPPAHPSAAAHPATTPQQPAAAHHPNPPQQQAAAHHPNPPLEPAAGRQRKCKECGGMFTFVARKTLCDNCGVQPYTAPKRRATQDQDGSSSGSDSDSSSSSTAGDAAQGTGPVGMQRKRAAKFTPAAKEVVAILFAIAADCPYTHSRDSQKKVFKKCLKFCHANNLIKECLQGRQLKRWCDKVCEENYKVMQQTRSQSGLGEMPKATVLDTVTEDWADFALRSGKISKVNKRHAEIIRQACTSTSTPVQTFAQEIASGRERHNAIMRTTGSSSQSTAPSVTSPQNSSAAPSMRQSPREQFAQAMQSVHVFAGQQHGTTTVPEGFDAFKAALVECERHSFPGPSKLEAHVASIMTKLGVSCMEELSEVQDGQEAACNLPVLHTNRLKAIISAQKGLS